MSYLLWGNPRDNPTASSVLDALSCQVMNLTNVTIQAISRLLRRGVNKAQPTVSKEMNLPLAAHHPCLSLLSVLRTCSMIIRPSKKEKDTGK